MPKKEKINLKDKAIKNGLIGKFAGFKLAPDTPVLKPKKLGSKKQQVLVACSKCHTQFIREAVGKEACGICGDGIIRQFRLVEGKVGRKRVVKMKARQPR